MNNYKFRKPLPIGELISADEYGYEKMHQLIKQYNCHSWLKRLEIIDELRNINHEHAHDCIRRAVIHDEATIVRSTAWHYANVLGIEKNGHPIALHKMKGIFCHLNQKSTVNHLLEAKERLIKEGKETTPENIVEVYKRLRPAAYDFIYGRMLTEEMTLEYIESFCRNRGILPRK